MRWGVTALAVLAVSVLAACTSAGGTDQAQQPLASGDGSVAAAVQGEQLTRASADSLEQKLQNAPDDLYSREELVGYYFIGQALGSPRPGTVAGPNAAVLARNRHILWLIQHAPALELLGTTPLGVVQPQPDAAGYSAASSAWSAQLSGQATAKIEGNAGIFFAQASEPRAIGLLTAAEAGDAQNPNWPDALGDLFVHQARSSSPGSGPYQQSATAAVRELEKAWSLGGGSNRDPHVSSLAKLAVVAGLYAKASQYANILLQTFKPGAGQNPLSEGGPIHDGNMVLGQVALHNGDMTGAQQYLLKAGATPGSPQLNQFGPNFSLARDLLAAGARNVVLQYCDEVSKFWSDPKLAQWRAAIAAGQTPDFGDNLWN